VANDNIGKRSDRLVARQLRKSGVCAETNSSLETFVQRVRETYAEADEQRVLNEHAFKIASAEMADLNSQLEAKNEQLKQALESLTRSKQIERLNEELSSKNDALSRLANTDSLTGLLNRYSFSRSLQESATKLSDDEKLAVAIIDLDRFNLSRRATLWHVLAVMNSP